MRISLKRKEIPFEIEKPDSTVTTYKLVELSGAEREAYLDSVRNRMTFGADGKPTGFSTFVGGNTELVAMCVRDENGKKVSKETIADWPGEALVELFEQCQKLNSLTPKATDEAKAESKNG